MAVAPVAVLGQMRGGTSALAGLLRLAGVDMHVSPERAEKHEDTTLMRARMRLRPTTPGLPAVDHAVWAGAPDLLEEVRRRAVAATGPWGWKDANLIDVAEQVLPELPDGWRLALVLRRPEDVVESIRRHHAVLPADPGWARWPRLRYELLLDWSTHPGALVLDFDDMRREPAAAAASVGQWLGVKLDATRAEDFLAGGYREL